MTKPFASIVVVCYNMSRELPRTLYSLSPMFQRDLLADDYEVIVVDNGSRTPPSWDDFSHLGLDLTILTTSEASPSPVPAVNRGLNAAVGSVIGVFIDGARLASPGLLRRAIDAIAHQPRAVVGTRGRYLGSKFQRDAIAEGYCQETEDQLLASSGWESDGYRLFDISVFDESAGGYWTGPIVESNSLFMSRAMWSELEGFDPRFVSPGGGLVNLDTWRRACELPDAVPTVLLGEATFHQVHGGIATNGRLQIIETFYDEYWMIRGHDFEPPQCALDFWGSFSFLPPEKELLPPARDQVDDTVYAARLRLSTRFSRLVPRRARGAIRRIADVTLPLLRLGPSQGIRKIRRTRSDVRLIEGSDLFDAEWYLDQYPDVAAAGYRPAEHYALHGFVQRREPSSLFDANWYIDHYPDLRITGANPLVHFLRYGRTEGRRARSHAGDRLVPNREEWTKYVGLIESSELFDEGWYRSTYWEVQSSSDPAVLHYLRFGFDRRHSPGPRFDANWYRAENPDVEENGMDPLVHFLLFGREEGRQIRAVREHDRQVSMIE
ncbi:MAG: glycosyltransferase family 2 protein [Ilumatobacteraceae bacterium]